MIENKMTSPGRDGTVALRNETTQPLVSEDKESQNFTQPTYLNYARVLLDLVLTVALIIFVLAYAPHRYEAAGNYFRSHQVPIYVKNDFDLTTLFQNADRDKVNTDDSMKVQAFKTSITTMCTATIADPTKVTIDSHPMCVCIMASGSMTQLKTCLLTEPMPSKYSDWNAASVSTALILWFVASLATSVGTLPFISQYNIADSEGNFEKVLKWNRWIAWSCAGLTIGSLVLPLVYNAIFFKDDPLHIQSYFNLVMWSLFAVAFFYGYNYSTLFEYYNCYLETSELKFDDKDKVNFKVMTMKNFFLYLHFLVAAPAIALVLHLTQKWSEYHTIVNTTLILSTIFAVDGFSAEMSNYWRYRTSQRELHMLQTYPDETNIDAQSRKAKEMKEHKEEVSRMHTRLGLVRLFAWVVNAVMLLLLLTLAYPVEVEDQKNNSAVFVVVVVTIAGVFLFPDLVREFTDNVAWNSIQFRLYGDLLLRCLTFFFVWQASGGGQV